MAKLLKLVDPTCPGPSISLKKTDWNNCIFFQADKAELLQCPAKSKFNIRQLLEFQSINFIPMKLNIPRLDDGSGINSTRMKPMWYVTKHAELILMKLGFHRQNCVTTKTILHPSTADSQKIATDTCLFVKRVTICTVHPHFKLIQK